MIRKIVTLIFVLIISYSVMSHLELSPQQQFNDLTKKFNDLTKKYNDLEAKHKNLKYEHNKLKDQMEIVLDEPEIGDWPPDKEARKQILEEAFEIRNGSRFQ